MGEPKLLLLDEPRLRTGSGHHRDHVRNAASPHRQGLTLLLAEQSVDLALEIADHAYVLQVSRSVLSRSARELSGNPDVQRIYLGVG